MKDYSQTENISQTSKRMGVDRKTTRKYVNSPLLPSERGFSKRSWRTRADPFVEDWDFIEQKLLESEDWDSTTLFEVLQERRPGHYKSGQLRTLQRRLRSYRAQTGPPKEVFFSQEHIMGESLQTDFTHVDPSLVRIGGEFFSHMLCHSVLPCSNGEYATVCQSESLMALCRGISESLSYFGRTPLISQTDNSTAATHRVDKKRKARTFNDDYLRFCSHYGMKAKTIGVGKKEQNGDVESSHRHLKRSIAQALLVRGTNDFESIAEYEVFVQKLCKSRNAKRERFSEELSKMKLLVSAPWPEYRVYSAKVGRQSTVRVLANTYSVPSRLMGHVLTLHVYEYRIEAYFEGKLQMSTERLLGKYKAHIDAQHVIQSLLQKPGAFARYRYQECLFPSPVFRKTYDRLSKDGSGVKADLAYLRILNIALKNGEHTVESILKQMLAQGLEPDCNAIKSYFKTARVSEVPPMEPMNANLESYDELLNQEAC